MVDRPRRAGRQTRNWLARMVEVEDVALIRGLYFLQVKLACSFRQRVCLLGTMSWTFSYSSRSPVGRMQASITL